MEKANMQIIEVASEQTSSSSVSLSDVVARCARNWYWFLISLGFCCLVAGYGILSTRPTYKRSAVILIKESATRRLATSDLESMLSGSSGQVSSKVVNEVIAFQSPALMQETVKRLGLCTEYAAPGLFRSSILYGSQAPVNVGFVDVPSSLSGEFLVTQLDGGKCQISDMKFRLQKDKYKISETFSAAYGDTVSTPMGKVVVSLNPYHTVREKGEPKAVKVTKMSLNGATNSFLSRFSATSVDVKNRSDVLQLDLTDASVQRADDILNTVINIYNENWVSDKNKMAVSTSIFINERLATLQKELGDVDENISSFQSENLIPDVNALSDIYVEQSQNNIRMIQELENQLNMYRFLQNYLSNNPGIENLLPVSGGLSNSGVSNQVSTYNEIVLTRNGLLLNSSEKNPMVIDLNLQLESMRSAIVSGVENQILTIQNQINNLHGRERSLNSRIADSPTQAKYLLTVGREQKVKETLYLYLLQKREENELSQAFAAYNTRIITPPMGGSVKAAPQTLKIMLIAIFLGLFIPLLASYLIVLTDDKVRTKKDMESVTVPFLGEIPQYEREGSNRILRLFAKQEDVNTLVVSEGKRDIINEAFRVMRTNLEFILKKLPGTPVMIFTSFNPGSGKTFLSINTSMVLSLKGKKVLAIDGDMRHASLSEYVNSPKVGLSDYLSGNDEDYHHYLCNPEGRRNLSVFPVGTIPPNPAELISGDKFRKLIEKAKAEFDYIIIDCPPIDIVADTHVISDIADRTIFVSRAGVLKKSMLPQINRLESDKNLKNVCTVLNGISSVDGIYGTKNGYYSSKYNYYNLKG